jgi:thioesterase domain-containing protein/acyl carrier protein
MNDPAQTAKGFVTHPVTGERLYRTGDVGRYLPGGVIEFLGRRDSQVKIQGHRIELGEIETVLAACPGVASAVAAVQRPAGGSPRLVAYVVPEPGATLDDDELGARLGRKLPDYMVPRTIARLERLPLSSNGKVDRKALPAIGQDDRGTERRSEPSREPLDATEAELLAIWARVLKLERVGVNDDFFDLGGHSFEAVRVVGLVRELLGVSLSLGDIWEGRTVACLAERIRAGRDEPLSCLVDIKPRGTGTPLLLVHPAGGHVLCYRELAARLGCSVLAFQAPGLDGRRPALESISELARVYVEHLEEHGPEGAVILGGWSSGGLVAHEMAVQLRARGRSVEGVVIMDSPAPLVHRPIADDVLFEWFLGDLSLEPALQASVQALDRTGLTERQQLEQAAEVMRRHDVDLGADVEQLAAIYQVFKGIVRGSRAHHAHAVDADLLVLRAEQGVVQEFEHHPFADDADWGWRKLTRGTIVTGAVEATHYTLLRAPAVDVVVSLVDSWISRTRASDHATPVA